MNTDIDRARELSDNEAIDASMPFQLVGDTDIYDLAVILAGLRQLDMPHVIDWSRGSFGKATIHTHPDWFNREFANNPNVAVEPIPQHSAIKKMIDYEGVEIFCWVKATFVMEAV